MHACRQSFVKAALAWGRGLDKRDIAHNINFFMNVPVTPERVKLTEPVGLLTVPTEVSVTVAVHVDPCPMNTGLVQVTLVVVVRLLTVMVAGVVVLLAE